MIVTLTLNGRNFRTRASSLEATLIAFAYEVQEKQIVGGPEWLNKDRYDIDAGYRTRRARPAASN